MTPDFIYYSYSEAASEESEVLRERSEVVTSRAPVAQKLSDLHLAEPWVCLVSSRSLHAMISSLARRFKF